MLFPHVMEVLMSQVMSSDDPYKLEEQPGDTQLDQTSILFLIQELKLFPYFSHTIDVSSVSARPFILHTGHLAMHMTTAQTHTSSGLDDRQVT